MLNTRTLMGIQWSETRGVECRRVFKVWKANIDELRRGGLETHLAVPCHVLDRQDCSVGQDIHVESALRALRIISLW